MSICFRTASALLLPWLFLPSLSASGALHQQDQKNDVKGQEQIAGALGQFGKTYTLKNKFNLTFLGAKYSIDPVEGYNEPLVDTKGKMLLIYLALKNADTQDQFVNTDSWFTAFDDKGRSYNPADLSLRSRGSQGLDLTLKPGQGVGQPDLNDPLVLSFQLPADARVTKIIVNQGRLTTSEEAIRFLMVKPPTDPKDLTTKNFIAPLPDSVKDATDAYGALAIDEGKAVPGQYYPSGGFNIKLVDLSSPADIVFNGDPAEEGKRYVVLTMTGQWLMEKEGGIFELYGGGDPKFQLLDTDGEQYKSLGARKLKSDEAPEHTFKKGDEYSLRMFFLVPKAAKIKHVTFGVANGRNWGVDLPQ